MGGGFQAELARFNRFGARSLHGLLSITALALLCAALFRSDGGPGFLIILTTLLLGRFAAVVIHELGHALTCWLVGWRVWIISAAPFAVRIRPLRIQGAMSKTENDGGGYVVTTPSTNGLDTRLRGVLVSLGGPLASWLAACSLLVWTYRLQQSGVTLAAHDLAVAMAALAFGLQCAADGVLTTWPFRLRDGTPNDAAKIMEHVKRRRKKPRETPRAIGWGMLLERHGIPSETWDDWIAAPFRAAQAARAFETTELLPAMAAGDFAAAEALLGDADDAYTTILRAWIDVSARGDAASAEDRLASLEGSPPEWPAGMRARDLTLIAIMTSAGEYESAQRRLDLLADEISRDAAAASWSILIDRARKALPASALSA